MATKNWKKKYDNWWEKDSKGFSEQIIIDKQDNMNRVGLYWYNRLKKVLKKFKTKSQALKYARAYMRNN